MRYLAVMFLAATLMTSAMSGAARPPSPDPEAPGELRARSRDGRALAPCPLERTAVRAEIAGGLSRVTVTQHFRNTHDEPVEAVYTFPLSRRAAVDRMTMRIGDRLLHGKIMRREEAAAAFEAARSAGQTASLLDQERPNVFTQSVTNVAPGARVEVTISYVEPLEYADGAHRFVFPMVVGPRYSPPSVRDAGRIAPPVAPRAGHDVTIEVDVDAGVPLGAVHSTSHEIAVERLGPSQVHVGLRRGATLPNADFVLEIGVAGRDLADGLLAHRDGGDGFFMLVLQPPATAPPETIAPKELVFVVDTSGSMEGFPIAKAKEAVGLALAALHPADTFNLITFSGDTSVLFAAPVPATPANVARAHRFLASRTGEGGTEMMTAIRAALAPSGAPDHVRVVCFATDGYVGNDLEILDEVRRHPSARVFALGIGDGPNRFLLDGMAEAGRGEVDYVSLSEDGSAAARRFERRVRNPLLTDVSIEWGGLDVVDLQPARIPDVFDARPVVVCGRYRTPGRGTVRLRGTWGGRAFEREVEVELPERETRHDALAKLWARARVDALARQDYEGQQRGEVREDLREAITRLGLDYGLLTDYTSFVAVEERPSVDGGRPVLVEVPVELPRGMSQCGSVTEDFSLWGMSQRMDWSTRLYYLLMVAAVVYGAWLIVRAMRGQSKKGHG